MNIKYTYEEVKNYVNTLGYNLISKEYNGTDSSLIISDNMGYYYTSTFYNLRKYNNVRFAHPSNLYTIQNIKLWCKLNNKKFELLSIEYKGNNSKLKWKCLKEDCQEIFEMCWRDINKGCGCSYCSGKQVGMSNCLATKNPKLASEWHPTKNGDLTPYDVTIGSGKNVWWLCKNNPKHEWKEIISNRIKGSGCPYCSGKRPSDEYNLFAINPQLCKEWDYVKNKKLPQEYCPSGSQKVWWVCIDCGYRWEAQIASRNLGIGCPACSGKITTNKNNLLVNNPELCREWDYSKNKKNPEEYTPNSGEKVWWKCSKCKHEWKVSIGSRNNGKGCPACSGRVATVKHNLLISNPELCKEWHYNKNKTSPTEYLPNSGKKVWWKCKECGNEWETKICNRNKGVGCPECNISKGEKRIENYLISHNFIKISQEEYDILDSIDEPNKKYYIPQETFDGLVGLGNGLLSYDFYLPQYKFLIEYQGEFHDGSSGEYSKQNLEKQKEHDRRKKEYAQQNNIRLLEIWYWDYENVESILHKELNLI